MGRIKDLRVKIDEGTATEEEKTELEELETEATEADEEEKSIDAMVGKIMSKIEAKITAKEEKSIDTKEEKKDEFEGLSNEEKTVKFIKALISDDKMTLKVLSEGTNADGGFLVPTYWYPTLVEELREDAQIRSRATVIDNCPKQFNITSLVGRPIVKFRAEKAIKDTSTVTFNQVSLTPYSLACIVPITKELVEDSEVGGSIISLVTQKIAQAIAEKEDWAFTVGTGTAEPTGFDNYNATVHRIVTTPANVLTSDSLIDVVTRLGTKYLSRAVWVMNSITYRKAMQLKDSQNRYLFIADPTGKTPGSILGYPVIRQDDLPAARIWFGDLKGYYIGIRGGLTVDQSEQATLAGVGNLWEQNMVAIRVEERIDGELVDLDSMAVLTGTN